jgi:hypothetical protein
MPSPSAPIRFAAGIWTPSRLTVVVVDPVRPIFFSGAPNARPAAVPGTWNAEMPRLGSGEVRAKIV